MISSLFLKSQLAGMAQPKVGKGFEDMFKVRDNSDQLSPRARRGEDILKQSSVDLD